MREKVVAILKRRENRTISLLFVLFFPVKTQLQNSMYYIFDVIFTHGITTKIFTYNYRGRLLGCKQVAQIRDLETGFTIFQQYGVYYFRFILPLLAFFLLLRRYKQGKTFYMTDWILTLITCFAILDAIETSFIIISKYSEISKFYLIRFLPLTLVFLAFGGFIFFNIFSNKERLQTIFIGLPSIILGGMLWFRFIGPKILPVII